MWMNDDCILYVFGRRKMSTRILHLNTKQCKSSLSAYFTNAQFKGMNEKMNEWIKKKTVAK